MTAFGQAPWYDLREELGCPSHACRNEPALRPDEVDVSDATHKRLKDRDDVGMGKLTDQ